MKKIYIVLSIIGGLLIILGIMVGVTYNNGIKYRHEVDAEYASISIAIENRLDAQQTLLEAVSGIVEHAETQLTLITEARSKLLKKEDITEITNNLEVMFNETLLVLEDNNTVDVSNAYNAYMANSTALINMIAYRKNTYNAQVSKYNTYIAQFPRNIILKSFGFSRYHLYDPNLV